MMLIGGLILCVMMGMASVAGAGVVISSSLTPADQFAMGEVVSVDI